MTAPAVDSRFHDAVIFDLDGVVTNTAALHAAAWTEALTPLLARRFAAGEQGRPFGPGDYRRYVDGKLRIDGLRDFLCSRGLTVPIGDPSDTEAIHSLHGICALKDRLFRERVTRGEVSTIAASVDFVQALCAAGIACAVFSASRNGAAVLRTAGIENLFGVRVTGLESAALGLPGKPDPAVLVEVTRRLGVEPARTVVVEDSVAGVRAAVRGGFGLVVGLSEYAEELLAAGAHVVVRSLGDLPCPIAYPCADDVLDAVAGVERIGANRPAIVVDYDAVGSFIDTDSLVQLARHCGPVALISDRAVADLRSRLGILELWYVGGRDVNPPGSMYLPQRLLGVGAPDAGATVGIGERLRILLSRWHIGSRTPVVYIGDDENAYDALPSGGFGVRTRRGTRRTAATFALECPQRIGALLDLVVDHRARADDSWTVEFAEYLPAQEKLREALCTVGNGYFATRGAAADAVAGDLHYPGTYAAVVHNRLVDTVAGTPVGHESVVNLPNWLAVSLHIDGVPIDLDRVDIVSYHRAFDLRRATATRTIRFTDREGRTSEVTERRFAAMHAPHVGCLEYALRAENWSGSLELTSTVDGNVTNSLVERYRELASRHFGTARVDATADGTAHLAVTTSQSGTAVAIALRNRLYHNATAHDRVAEAIRGDGWAGHRYVVELSPGDVASLEKSVCIFTSRDHAISEPGAAAAQGLAEIAGFESVLADHTRAWSHLWDAFGMELPGRPDVARLLRFEYLHMVQTTSPHTADLDVGVPARGMHGEAYRGHIFWDELFVFAVHNLRFPDLTRALIRYRYRRLPAARAAARRCGHRGAMFPWQSGTDGREESPALHLNPLSGRWNPDPSARQHHIGLAIAFGTWQYFQVTGNVEFLVDWGAELIVDIARFFVDLAVFDELRGRYVIRSVIGPDEFHSGYPSAPYDGMDNNAYTNIMTVWVVRTALTVLDRLPLRTRVLLLDRLRIRGSELDRWRDVVHRMFVPFHDGVISQFEGYAELAELDWAAYRARYGDVRRLDRILEAENDDVNRYQVTKQADVLMLFYLLSADELRDVLQPLGYALEPEMIPRTIEYYLARTSHGSTLSAPVHAWVLQRGNRERAMEFFDEVLNSDLGDLQHGTTAEGIHIAATASGIDLVQRCFSGLEVRDDKLVLNPVVPASLGTVTFAIRYRGHGLTVRINGRQADVSSEPGVLAPIAISCRGSVEHLRPGHRVTFGRP